MPTSPATVSLGGDTTSIARNADRRNAVKMQPARTTSNHCSELQGTTLLPLNPGCQPAGSARNIRHGILDLDCAELHPAIGLPNSGQTETPQFICGEGVKVASIWQRMRMF
jgi:hypothetical protein